ncbi:MAG: TetR family transcriptional regulator [Myxococcota bacterium]
MERSAKRAIGSSAAASRLRVAAAGRGADGAEAVSLRDRKKRRTWESIASTTVELVVERGFDAVRVEDVCAAAEVGRSTFFRYFDSKEAAFVAGVHRGRLEAVVAAMERRPADEDALTALSNAFLETYSDWREQRELMQLEAGIRAVSAQVKVRSLGQQVAWESFLARVIEPRLAAGPRRALHARLLAATIVSAVRMANDRWLEDGAKRSPAKDLTAALEAVRELVGGDVLAAAPGRSRPAPRPAPSASDRSDALRPAKSSSAPRPIRRKHPAR